MEIELRCKAPSHIHDRVLSLRAVKKSQKIEDDEYFKFALDVERKLVLRIRRKNTGESLLTFKGSSKAPEDTAWQEWETSANDPEALKKLLLSNGLVSVVRIVKNRTTYKLEDFEINVDEIQDLGTFVEVELQSEDFVIAHKRIRELLARMDIHERDIITKGYVPLMIEKNAQQN
ncbi:MAG TPA: class IV adenylate cyclase [Acidobacteriota bacterium]|nr:class IV adenylate cyclase [Acidobacteriota bacterium]